MLNRRSFSALTAAIPFAAGATLAGSREAEAATPKDILVVVKQIDDMITCDPGEQYEITGGEVVIAIYDTILRYVAEDVTKIIGGVADKWSVSADGKTYTFHIKPGLKFESGAPVTAEDAAWSLQRVVLLDKTPAFLWLQLGLTKENVKSLITAPDPSTLVVKITKDFAPSLVYNLMTVNSASVVEKKVAMSHEVNGDLGNSWLKTNSAGSGPFRLISWKANESITMEANPAFHLGAPLVKRVVIRHVPEPASQRLLLEKGDADIARDLTPDQLTPLATNKAIKVESYPGDETWYMAMNLSDEHFAKPQVRMAMKYLVDYDGMVNTFLKGRFFVHQTYWPIGLFDATKYNPYKLDVAKAKALLAEAGYPNGFEVNLSAGTGQAFPEIAQSVQQTMGLAGIKVNLIMSDGKQVITNYRARKHQMVLLNWSPDYFDPHANSDSFAHNTDNSDTAAIHPLAWRNHWLIPEISQQVAEAAKELDATKRAAMYAALEKKVTDDGPFIIMFQNTPQVAMRANVKDFIFALDYDNYKKVKKS